MIIDSSALDITALRNVSSNVIREAAAQGITSATLQDNQGLFQNILNTAISNIETTNAYLSDREDAEIAWALGEMDNTHDLGIAIQKASTALNFTIAVRDKFMEAYKEIMQMQI